VCSLKIKRARRSKAEAVVEQHLAAFNAEADSALKELLNSLQQIGVRSRERLEKQYETASAAAALPAATEPGTPFHKCATAFERAASALESLASSTAGAAAARGSAAAGGEPDPHAAAAAAALSAFRSSLLAERGAATGEADGELRAWCTCSARQR